jgi:molecular chaperone GrpE
LSKPKKPEDETFDTDGVEIDSVEPVTSESETDGDEISSVEAKRYKAEADKWKNDYLYLRADFDNYRKAMIKERSDIVKYGTERLFVDLLDVFDNFERALDLDVNAENYTTFKDGIKLTAAELKKIFEKHGVREVKSLGEPFNPSFHEALSSEATAETPAGHVTRVFKKAYKLHERVIRPAQVVVAKPPESPSSEG